MQQQVYLSRTRSGQVGLFTNGVLAWPLDQDEVSRAAEIAKRLGFIFIPSVIEATE